MRRRIFTVAIVPFSVPKDLRRSILREHGRLLRRSPAFWVILALQMLAFSAFLQLVIPRFQMSETSIPIVGLLGAVVFFYVGLIWQNLFCDRYRIATWSAHHLCPDCAYNLTGNTSGLCPECGTACTALQPTSVFVEK